MMILYLKDITCNFIVLNYIQNMIYWIMIVNRKKKHSKMKNRIWLIWKADFVSQYPTILFGMYFNFAHITQNSTKVLFFQYVQFDRSPFILLKEKHENIMLWLYFSNLSQAKKSFCVILVRFTIFDTFNTLACPFEPGHNRDIMSLLYFCVFSWGC